MIIQKKNSPTAMGEFLKTKHKDGTPVISPIVAPIGAEHQQVDDSLIDPIGATESASKHQILLTGIDTLSITAGGNVAPTEWLLEQQNLWNEYQQSYEFGEDYITIEMDNKWWSVYPSRCFPYKFQLRNDEIGFIKIWNCDKWSSGANGKQQIHIHFYSKFLHSHSPQTIYKEINQILSNFFVETIDLCIQVSRIDLHTDISNGDKFLTQKELDNAICRAKIREQYYEDTELVLTDNEQELLFQTPPTNNKGGGKLIPQSLLDKVRKMIDNQFVSGADNTIRKRELETAYFGKKKQGILWGKIYDKTKEIRIKNDTDTPKLWNENGYNGYDCVVRVEFTIKRDLLKQLNGGIYVNLLSCLSNIDTLWKYLTHEWLRLVECVKINNSTTSIITDFWNVVSNSFDTPTKNIIRKKDYRGKITQLWSQGLGCIKQMISLGMDNNEDEYFISATITALSDTLSNDFSRIEYMDRRKLLGVY